MNRSTSNSMFDGLQIFGKTDSKFSMTQSSSSLSKGTPLLNSNYKFQSVDNTTLPPPAPPQQLQSLPPSFNRLDDEVPPQPYNFVQSRDTPHSPPEFSRNMNSLPKTWGNPNDYERSTIVKSPSKTEIPPLQEVNFSKTSPPQVSPYSLPPMLDNNSTEPPLDNSDKIKYFFRRCSSEVEAFQNNIQVLQGNHDELIKEAEVSIKLHESALKAISLGLIQRLMKFGSESLSLKELQNNVQQALQDNDYEAAERLQSEIDLKKRSGTLKLIQFELPRQLTSIQENLQSLNTSRKTYVESLKSFCVDLDEQSTKFKSVAKKIEVQCSSKIDKQMQDLDAAQNTLECKTQHLRIDKDHHEKQAKFLEADIISATNDFNLQTQYQNEALESVQSEIRELEKKLLVLKNQEQRILEEKHKILIEKDENEKLHQERTSQLQTERDQIHVKSVTLDQEQALLNERKLCFDSHSSSLEQISVKQGNVAEMLTSLKSRTCDAISQNEGLIVNEVQASMTTDTVKSLRIPEFLSEIFTKIADTEKRHQEKSDYLYDCQRQLTKLKSEETLCRSNLSSSKALKEQAIRNKRYHEASQISKEEVNLESQIQDITDKIKGIEDKRAHDDDDVNKISAELETLQKHAFTQQTKFDADCHKLILQQLVESLASLPAASSVTKDLLEYDITYMYCYLNVMKSRDSSLETGSGDAKVEEIYQKVTSQIDNIENEATKLKDEIEVALRTENFEKAEMLNKKYELLQHRGIE